MDDERFKSIATDPRFRPLPSRFRKVKIDDRFKGMFTEKKFKVKCSVDERGRPVKLSSNKHLKKFYELSSSEESSGEEGDEDEAGDVNDVSLPEYSEGEDVIERNVVDSAPLTSKAKKDRKRKKKRLEENVDEKSDDENELQETVEVKKKEINPMEDYARGVVLMSSSSEDEDDDETAIPYDQEAHDDHYWGEHDDDAEGTEEITSRLAIQNMDWDRIKVYDLFMLLNSFKPPTGTVHSVKIYPSEFGKEKMKQDEVTGPKELRNSRLNDAEEAEGKLKLLSEKDQKKAMLENMRQYQLNRLKYYYAIAEFDSAETANYIYTNCDNKEYLASCTQLDLRFVPEGMEFNEDDVKDSANHVPDNYEPRFFINPALGQSLVRCTWDESGPDRYGVLNKKYKSDQLEQLDMDDYLASESDEEREVYKTDNTECTASHSAELVDSDSDVEDESSIDKYRALLLGGADKSKEEEDSDGAVDLEITWDTGLKDTAEDMVKNRKNLNKGKGLEMSVFDRDREKKRNKAKQLKKEKQKMEKEAQPKVSKGEKKSKKRNVNAEEDNSNEEAVQAFSDDELPEEFDMDHLMDSTDRKSATDRMSGTDRKSGKKKNAKPKLEVEEDNTGQLQCEGGSLDLMLMNSADGAQSKKHFNMKEIAEYDNMTKSKRKRKMKKNQLKKIEDDFQVDVGDDRFRAVYSSHLYNIDPSSQDYRKTKAMDAIINEKQRRIRDNEQTVDKPKKQKLDTHTALDPSKPSKLNKSNISSLVKSVKAKAKLHSSKQNVQQKKRL